MMPSMRSRWARRWTHAVLALAAIWAIALPPARGAESVDLLLVLAADVSRSVDAPKFQLQRDGYAAAINNPRVLDAIQSGPNGKIAICFVEWSGSTAQRLVIDWTVIGDAKSAKNFASQVIEAPRSFSDRTSISGGIDFAVSQFTAAPFEGGRKTIDVSGDGTNNSGRDVTAARDDALARGIVINGLVILSDRPTAWNTDHTNPPGGLVKYFEDNVVGGPGAFVVAAEDFNAFGDAIVKKMIAEIATAPYPVRADLGAAGGIEQ